MTTSLDREKKIVEILHRQGKASILELVETFGVSSMTIHRELDKLAEAGIKKIAFLVSAEMIAQLSIEQTLEESNASAFAVKYFDVEEDAKKWLLG